MVLRKHSSWVWPKYSVPGLRDDNKWNLKEYRYPFGKVKYSACHSLGSLAAWMACNIKENRKFDIVRVGDGEMLLLNNKIKGNLITRHNVERGIDEAEIIALRKLCAKTTTAVLCYEFKSMQSYWGKNDISKYIRDQHNFDVYAIYQLISSTILFRLLSGKTITILSANEKCKLIEKRLFDENFKSYLGLNSKIVIKGIPQLGCVNHLDKLKDTIQSCSTDVVLYGMGVAKLFLANEFMHHNSSFIDIGSGIDALAGIIPKTRPYFANWDNFVNLNTNFNESANIDYLSQ